MTANTEDEKVKRRKVAEVQDAVLLFPSAPFLLRSTMQAWAEPYEGVVK
jgi:hypothetical protein